MLNEPAHGVTPYDLSRSPALPRCEHTPFSSLRRERFAKCQPSASRPILQPRERIDGPHAHTAALVFQERQQFFSGRFALQPFQSFHRESNRTLMFRILQRLLKEQRNNARRSPKTRAHTPPPSAPDANVAHGSSSPRSTPAPPPNRSEPASPLPPSAAVRRDRSISRSAVDLRLCRH